MSMLISDYDGTFYLNESNIKKNIKAIEKFNQNNLFVIATGRSFEDFLITDNIYHSNYNYLIINHGATILKKNKIIYNKSIDENIKSKLINDLKLNITFEYFAYSMLDNKVPLNTTNLTKLHISYNDVKTAKKIAKTVIQKYNDYIDLFFIRDKAFEIVAKNVNKANAINKLMEIENITTKNIYTIGDSYNDIQMIKRFQGFAMANSIEELKSIAIREYESVSDLINDILSGKYEKIR